MATAVLPSMCALADDLALPRMTLGDYADFWAQREHLTPRVRVDRATSRLEIDVPSTDPPVLVESSSPLRVTLNGVDAGAVSSDQAFGA